jgi:hypothetical protein
VVSDFETLFVDSSIEDIDSSVEHIEKTLRDLSQTEALDPATLSNSYRNAVRSSGIGRVTPYAMQHVKDT